MKTFFFILLLFIIPQVYAQTETILRVQSVEQKLTNKPTGWKLISTNDRAMTPGANIYFYFSKNGQLNVYAQKNHYDSKKELIYEGEYSIYDISPGRVGVTISNFYGNMKLFFIANIDESKIGDTSFEFFYNSNENKMKLVYAKEQGKLYYVNLFQ